VNPFSPAGIESIDTHYDLIGIANGAGGFSKKYDIAKSKEEL